MKKSLLICVMFMFFCVNFVNADALSDSNRLFDWAEANYPDLFQAQAGTPAATFPLDVYLVRHYPVSGTYLGTYNGTVYVYGEIFGGLVEVGSVSTYLALIDAPPAGVFSDAMQSSFQAQVDNLFASRNDTAGMSVAVYKGQYPVWKYARGDAATSVPMTTETPSVLYSITKTMISAEILKLVESGNLSLTDTVGQALAGHTDLASFDSQKINLDATIAELLKHTSGIQDYAGNSAGIGQITTMIAMGMASWKPANLISLVQDNYHNVGTHQYSGTNYVLLGMIIEQKTGQPLNLRLQENLFASLGITGKLLPQDASPLDLAKPFDDLASAGGSTPGFGSLMSVQPYYMTGVGATTWAGAGMTMTAENVAKWGYELYSSHGTALSSTLRDEVLLTSPTAENSNYGYGVTLEEMTLDGTSVNLYGHGGGGNGYLTKLYYSPTLDLSVAILTNSNNSTSNAGINTFTSEDLFNLCTSIFSAYSAAL